MIITVPSTADGEIKRRRSSFFVNRQAHWPSCQIALISPRSGRERRRDGRSSNRASTSPAPSATGRAPARVGIAGHEPNPCTARDRDHRRSSTSRIRARDSVSTSLWTRRRRPPLRSIITRLIFLRGRETGDNSGDAFGGGTGRASTTSTGTSCGTAGADIWQSSLRQRKSRLSILPADRPPKRGPPVQISPRRDAPSRPETSAEAVRPT